MTVSSPHPASLRRVRAQRISTADPAVAPVDEDVSVVVETAVTIDVDGAETYTLLCTPDDIHALALGFLLSEGIVQSMDHVASVRPCTDDSNVVRVRLRSGDLLRAESRGRNLLIVSSCGMCGVEDLESKVHALPKVTDTLRLERQKLRAMSQTLNDHQHLFRATGGAHAVGIFDGEGNMLSIAEDAGRHNALDKAIGKRLLADRSSHGSVAVLSSRASLEMIGKCARAGIELVSAISAPTSLAIDAARRCDITLCAFVRKTRATIFTNPRRVV